MRLIIARMRVNAKLKDMVVRLTAHELLSLSIPSVMLCDSMVGSLFQHNDIAGIGMYPGVYSIVAHVSNLTVWQ